jgi:hypothetical protein
VARSGTNWRTITQSKSRKKHLTAGWRAKG